MVNPARAGAIAGLLSAALFGLSTPFAKLLLPGTTPLMLAGLLYLGGGIGLSLFGMARTTRREARLRRSDWPLLAAIIFSGGVMGPLLMLLGLQRMTAVSSALLLNLEAPLTILIAVTLFREHLGRHEAMAAAIILLGAGLLGFRPGSVHLEGWGVVALVGACACWALDNNLTQRLSLREPLAVVRIKALGAGSFNFVLALLVGQRLPPLSFLCVALGLGAISYGASIVLDMYALRLLGAAREAAYFATAPFIGAVASVFILRESMAAFDVFAGALMASGVVLLIRARHGHAHRHEAIEHEHLHIHDAHHQHHHEEPVQEPHSHPHVHEALVHDHPHVSDLHHRHAHH